MKKMEISASSLKWIALITMLIDHFAVCLWLNIGEFTGLTGKGLIVSYYALRCIGRFAFPLFIFLLAEGFYYTRSRKKYLIRLLAFAFISEIPFDLALYLNNSEVRGGQIFTLAHQNVYFTLVFGFLSMLLLEEITKREWARGLKVLAGVGVLVLCGGTAELFHTDYGFYGVLAITEAWYLRRTGSRLWEMAAIVAILTVSAWIEAVAFLNLPLVAGYHGKQGKKGNRWFFYAFYPLHLFLLFCIRMILF